MAISGALSQPTTSAPENNPAHGRAQFSKTQTSPHRVMEGAVVLVSTRSPHQLSWLYLQGSRSGRHHIQLPGIQQCPASRIPTIPWRTRHDVPGRVTAPRAAHVNSVIATWALIKEGAVVIARPFEQAPLAPGHGGAGPRSHAVVRLPVPCGARVKGERYAAERS
jgi:hypothetical protein